jgi:ATP-dependent RNA helicase MSS116
MAAVNQAVQAALQQQALLGQQLAEAGARLQAMHAEGSAGPVEQQQLVYVRQQQLLLQQQQAQQQAVAAAAALQGMGGGPSGAGLMGGGSMDWGVNALGWAHAAGMAAAVHQHQHLQQQQQAQQQQAQQQQAQQQQAQQQQAQQQQAQQQQAQQQLLHTQAQQQAQQQQLATGWSSHGWSQQQQGAPLGSVWQMPLHSLYMQRQQRPASSQMPMVDDVMREARGGAGPAPGGPTSGGLGQGALPTQASSSHSLAEAHSGGAQGRQPGHSTGGGTPSDCGCFALISVTALC